LRRLYFLGKDRYVRAVLNAFSESNNTIRQSKQRMVFANAYVGARVVGRTALTHDNVTGNDGLTTEDFYA